MKIENILFKDLTLAKKELHSKLSNKSGIYKFTNKLNGNFYISSSLSKRFIKYFYFNLSYFSTVKK